MGINHMEQRLYNADFNVLLNAARQIPNYGSGYTFVAEGPRPYGAYVSFRHKISWLSYGEEIMVSIDNMSNGVMVTINSECVMPTQIIDYGINRENVMKFFMMIDNGIATAVKPNSFCTKCGNRIEPDSRFCTSCGNQIY